MAIRIRPATEEDAAALREIEWRAGEQFRDIGMPEIAAAEPLSVEAIAAYATAGRSWVAADGAGEPVGYVIVDVVDGNAHVEQISVDPEHQGIGIGRLLINEVREWALTTGRPALTLTTFTDVPWNRPLYEHLGFVVIDGDDVGSELEALRLEEASHGLDPDTRVCMRLAL